MSGHAILAEETPPCLARPITDPVTRVRLP